jgi:S1-C subfamily serine protease
VILALVVAAQIAWTPIADRVRESLVYVEVTGGSCSGFVIDAERDYVLTAAHCDGEKMFVDKIPAKLVAKDTKHDLMVLEVKDIGDDHPALKLAKEDPKIGDTIASYGFGYGYERPMFRITHVADDDTYIPENGIGGPLVVIDAAFVGGQSGGPVIDANGDVVMIVQMGSDRVGLGRGAKEIQRRMGKYFQK